jgi:hypothetical protein
MDNYRYKNEERVIWLKDKEALAKLPYVYESFVTAGIRTGPVRPPKGYMLIGYSVLKKSVPRDLPEGFVRRIFTLKLIDDDQEVLTLGLHEYSEPERTVNPSKVEAGKPSN